MDSTEFKKHADSVINYMINYLETIESRQVFPDIKPGYMEELLPKEAPVKPEKFETILEDVERFIMPGVTHWQHPQFHAYFANANSYPNALADMVSGILGVLASSWSMSPAATELEQITLNWLAKAVGLPDEFCFHEGGAGGGVLQGSASECIFTCMLAARNQAFKYIKEKDNTPNVENNILLPKLVCYASVDAHSCVEKAAVINMVEIRLLESDSKCELQGETVEKAIEEDINKGLVPFFVSATFGTTGSASFDNIASIGAVCQKYPSVWFHVDGAYGGNALICPELRYLFQGIEYVHSININPNKWMQIAYDVSCMWVRNRKALQEGLAVDPVRVECEDGVVNYRDWTFVDSRRFRALKVWFTMTAYGIEGLQAYIRNHRELAKYFEGLVRNDSRFEIVNDVRASLVCFRLKGTDELNQDLLALCNSSREIHMVPALIKNQYVIRFCICAPNAKKSDVAKSWEIIQKFADNALALQSIPHNTPEDLSFVHYVDEDTLKIFKCHSLCDESMPIPHQKK